MTPIRKKHFAIMLVSVLLVILSLWVAHAQTDAGAPAFLASTWEMDGDRIAADSHYQYFRVNIADRTQTLLPYRDDHNWAFYSPDRQKFVVAGGWDGKEGQIGSTRDGSIQTFHFDSYVSSPQVWSPDSRYLTFLVHPDCGCERQSPFAELGILDTQTGDSRILTTGEYLQYDYQGIAWSSDSKWLAYLERRPTAISDQYIDRIKVIPADGSQPPRTLFTFAQVDDRYNTGIFSPSIHWLPYGRQIALNAYTGLTSDVWYFDVEREQVSFHYTSSKAFDVCWGTTSDHFIAVTDSTFTLLTPEGAAPLDLSFVDSSIWRQRPASTVPCAWSPDGTKMSLVYWPAYLAPPVVSVIDLEKQRVIDLQVDVESVTLKSFWSPDSRYLAVTTYDTGLDPSDVYIYDADTMEQVLVRKSLQFIAWIPNDAS